MLEIVHRPLLILPLEYNHRSVAGIPRFNFEAALPIVLRSVRDGDDDADKCGDC
jgi:hypothetical protein